MIKTYTYKIKPSISVDRKFTEWTGICRFVYNCSKELIEAYHSKRLYISSFDIQKQLTLAKKDNEFIRIVNAQTLAAVISNLDLAYRQFFIEIKKKNKASKPKWASKKTWKSIPFKTIKIENNSFILPSFGKIRVFKFKHPKGELRTASIVKEADGLYLKVVVREPSIERERDSQSIVAIDMGLKYFMVTSDGEFVDNPKHLFKRIRELRVAQRKLSRMKKGGSNWKKQKNIIQIIHQKTKRCRKDFVHKQSRKLADLFDYVVIENLNIKGLSMSSVLSKHILDCGWGLMFNCLGYKTRTIKVSPNHSSQECSVCHYVSKHNRPYQSVFKCINCNHSNNADLNASKVLLSRGRSALGANVNH